MNSSLDNLRHTTAHLLAAAVIELFPDTLPTIGPAVEDGFYYDFDFKESISDEDLAQIESKMQEILPSWTQFESREVSVDEARETYQHNPYKLELIDEIAEREEAITLYKAGNFEDLCRGGHAKNPSKEVQAFKLLSLAGAYWRGNEKNKMLTRIYGTSFPSQEELEEHLNKLEEAKKRDHKKLGRELDLFVFSETVGKGLPLWTPKGSVIRRELERFIVDEELKRGYQHVYTPDVGNLALYEKSGHYPYYQESMYAPITIDDERYMLRPMTCPHHFELYLSRPHSYKELPLRYAELAKLYRYEQSGELSGLQRVRSFTLADAHIIATKDQAEQEIHNVLDLIEHIAGVFGLRPGEEYHYRLSLGDRSDEKKYFKDDSSWDGAENVLRNVLAERNAHFVEAEGEAAFYGPKIDIQMKNVNGKEDTAFTVQYDFVMPKRFNLSYIDSSGDQQEPIVIHRSSIGAIERVVAFLIEHYAGKFPLWLSPVQVSVIPITSGQNEFGEKVQKRLFEEGIRTELRSEDDTMQAKIREATLQKVPYMCIIGGKEERESQEQGKVLVAVRARTGENLGVLDLESFILKIKDEVGKKQ